MSAPPPETYLAPGFNPAKLTVPQLRSVLLAHGQGYSARIKKDELVREFETHVASQASTLRQQAAAVVPSDAGIISVSDAGEEAPAVPTKRPRRSSRRSTAEPESSDVPAPAQTEVTPEPPTKRSRSKARTVPVVEIEATPRRGGGKRKTQPVIQVEDVDEGVDGEIEDEPIRVAPTPSRRTTRGRSSMTPATPAPEPSPSVPTARTAKVPRSSRKSEPAYKAMENFHEESEKDDTPQKKAVKTPRRSAGDEPAFSDFNPFQSGSEAAAEKERRRRKSSIGFAPTPKQKPDQPRYAQPGPSAVTPPPGILRRMGPSRENLRTPPSEVKRRLAEGDLDDAVAYNHEVQDKLNRISRDAQVVVHTSKQPAETSFEPEKSLATRVNDQITHTVPAPRATLPLSVLFLLLLTFLSNYKSQSSSIGFCDTSFNSNEIALSRLDSRTAAEACLEQRARLDATDREEAKRIQCDTSNLPLVPFLPVPSTCTPCPAHAQCSNGEIIACEPEYILSPSPIAFLSPLVDGLPGVGPRAFSPVCKPDTRLKRLIGSMAKELEGALAKHRGDVICEGAGQGSADGERFGEEEGTLRERYAGLRRQGVSREEFDQIFEAAIKDLVEHEDLVVSIDVENDITRYAAARTDLTLVCRGKLEAADLLDRWKSQLGSTAAVLALIAYIRSELARRKQDKYRATSLASVALKRIQDQEQLHYTDPVSTPHPFIPRDQLRDLVMPHKGATLGGSKARMWDKVVELVEGNANVTVREQEVKGEIWKTWEWSGVGERPIAHVTWEE